MCGCAASRVALCAAVANFSTFTGLAMIVPWVWAVNCAYCAATCDTAITSSTRRCEWALTSPSARPP